MTRLCRFQIFCRAGALCVVARALIRCNRPLNALRQLRKGRELVEESVQVQPVGRPHRLHEPLSQVLAAAWPPASLRLTVHLSPCNCNPQLLRPASLRPHVAPPLLQPPYAWPTSAPHPFDRREHPPPAAAAAHAVPHSELHAAADGDGACLQLHEHGRCFEAGAAKCNAHNLARHACPLLPTPTCAVRVQVPCCSRVRRVAACRAARRIGAFRRLR
jgi:hypothetical protein